MTRLKCIVLLLGVTFGVTAYAGSGVALIPEKWDPDIDVETISDWGKEYFQGSDGNMPQQGMNLYLGTLSELWDSKLMIAYMKLSMSLGDSDRKLLAKEQEAWLVRRAKEASEAKEEEDGGSLASTTYSLKYIELTEKRYQEIAKRTEK